MRFVKMSFIVKVLLMSLVRCRRLVGDSVNVHAPKLIRTRA